MQFDEMREANRAAARLLGYRVCNRNTSAGHIYINRPSADGLWMAPLEFNIFSNPRDLLDTFNALAAKYDFDIDVIHYGKKWRLRLFPLASEDNIPLTDSGWQKSFEYAVACVVLAVMEGKVCNYGG